MGCEERGPSAQLVEYIRSSLHLLLPENKVVVDFNLDL